MLALVYIFNSKYAHLCICLLSVYFILQLCLWSIYAMNSQLLVFSWSCLTNSQHFLHSELWPVDGCANVYPNVWFKTRFQGSKTLNKKYSPNPCSKMFLMHLLLVLLSTIHMWFFLFFTYFHLDLLPTTLCLIIEEITQFHRNKIGLTYKHLFSSIDLLGNFYFPPEL